MYVVDLTSFTYICQLLKGLHDYKVVKIQHNHEKQSLEEEIFTPFINNRRLDTGWTERH